MIALVDCNNFFVSCERLFNPKLVGKPVAVLSSNDGCVIARSNELKALGVAMGAPAFECADIFKKYKVITLSSNFTLYADISSRVMQVLGQWCGDVEEYSIDEAFLKLPASIQTIDQALDLGQKLRDAVLKSTGIPVSIGIAPTKTLAKAANKAAKKNLALNSVHCVTQSEHIQTLLHGMPVRDIWGIGHAYEQLLIKNKIITAYQLTQCADAWIKKNMTMVGLKMVWELRGKPCLTIQDCIQPAKSIIRSRSFGMVVTGKQDMQQAIAVHAARAGEKLRAAHQVTGHITVFVVLRLLAGMPWRNEYRSCTIQHTSHSPDLINTTKQLLESLFQQGYEYKKCGIVFTDLLQQDQLQASLLDIPSNPKSLQAMQVMDTLNQRMGPNTVYFAAMGTIRSWQAKRNHKSQDFTTDWNQLPKVKIG